MSRNTETFTTVRVEGSILPVDLLQRVAAGDARLGGLRPEDYHLAGEKINEATNHAWNRLLPSWDAFKAATEKVPPGDPGQAVTLNKWLLPLWRTLEYGQLDPARPFEIDGKEYPISHVRYYSPIHLVGFRQDLDKRVETAEGKKPSPHGLVQEFLNRSEAHMWGFVSNGLKLRVLRDNIRLTRQAFVEFDLQAMFDGKVYSDFALLWRLCHESRVHADRAEQCWLEKWSKAAAEQGLRALDQLRGGVENAVEALGRGFLHPANAALLHKLRTGTLKAMDYYRQLLRVVYRLLFLCVAEDRELLFDPAAPEPARDRYTRFYSTARLRRLAERLRGTQHTDLYQGLDLILTRLGTTGSPELGLPALGGLFDPAGTADLGRCRISNADLLEAVRALAVVDDERSRARRPVDYRNLGSEELGSVYESLLELHPQFTPDPSAFVLKSTSGNERKTTGSYYTPTGLITCLLDSALDPVLNEAATRPNPEKAILDLKVCDPACGSGHFLIAAAHRIAKRLASVRTQEEEPAPDAIRHALRDVIGRCVFGVDINPMAVELCQVALWMEALEPGKPLSFLKHHVQCGNSLLGATPSLLAKGIPDQAFEPIEGDDRQLCRTFKRQNRDERRGQGDLFADLQPWERLGDVAAAIAGLDALPDDTAEQVRAKEQQYERLVAEGSYRTSGRLLADLWCTAFVWKKTHDFDYPITERVFRRVEKSPHDVTPWIYDEVRRLAGQYQLVHWHLAFPGVFRPPAKGEEADNEVTGWCGGFDVVLGNPPWERIKLQEQEWFAAHGRADIAGARTAAIRGRKIKELEAGDPALHRAFMEASRKSEGESHLVRDSSGVDEESGRRWGLYPFCGRGDVNTYSLFAELNRNLINPTGRVGCIVPSGIATDDTTKVFFQDLAKSGSLVSLLSFFEIRLIFVETDSRNPFCLLTLTGTKRPNTSAVFVFDARSIDELADPAKRFTLSPDDLILLNPNTRTCPVFKTARDAVLTKAIYRRIPVLIREGEPPVNAWSISFLRMFDMANDSGLFRTAADLTSDGWEVHGNVFHKGDAAYLPLYEAKMVHHFDHRWATYEGTESRNLSPEEKGDVDRLAVPRYWVPDGEVTERLRGRWEHGWLVGWRDMTRNTDKRTLIAGTCPAHGVGHKLLLLFARGGTDLVAALYGNLCSLVLDYVARQKLGGTSMGIFVVKQLPILQADAYRKAPAWGQEAQVAAWLLPRIAELTYTACDIKPFADDCGYGGEPYRWDEERRFQLRCELDAAYLHLYLGTGEWRQAPGEPEPDFLRLKEAFPTPRHAVDYIMDTFPLVRKADEEEHGHYRTKQRILETYDQLARTAVASPQLTAGQVDILKAMHYVSAFLQTWKRRASHEILEAGVALMIDDGLRQAFLEKKPLSSQRPGRRHASLLAWLPLALNRLCQTNGAERDSPEGLPLFRVGSNPISLAGLPTYLTKAAEAVKVITRLGEQQAHRAIEENIDDPTRLIPT